MGKLKYLAYKINILVFEKVLEILNHLWYNKQEERETALQRLLTPLIILVYDLEIKAVNCNLIFNIFYEVYFCIIRLYFCDIISMCFFI